MLIKGGGEMASGVAHRLVHSGFLVCLTEIAEPKAVRRGVAFSEAVFDGQKRVEDLLATFVKTEAEIWKVWQRKEIPILVDPECQIRRILNPEVIVDAIMAKKNMGTRIDEAPLVIGLGPGFKAGEDVHMVIETNRGHNLGKVILTGEAEPPTGIPGEIMGYTQERVLRAPSSGEFRGRKEIGERVEAGELVGEISGFPVQAKISGVLRGILRDRKHVTQGMKIGDIDPRGIKEYCFTISDKARAIAGGVLEAILRKFNI